MASNTTDKTADSIHAGTDAVAKMAHDAIDRVARRAEVAEERIRRTADDAEKKVRRSLTTMRDKSINAKGAAGQFVHDHPLACVGIALGVGVLLSALVRRRPANTDVSTDLH